MSAEKDSFGRRLKWLRSKRGLSQEVVAKELNISRARYSHYENDHVEPDMDLISKLATFFKVSSDYLLGLSSQSKLIDYSKNEEPSADEAEFEAWLNDPRVSKFYKEFNESPEERREALMAVWEILKKQGKY